MKKNNLISLTLTLALSFCIFLTSCSDNETLLSSLAAESVERAEISAAAGSGEEGEEAYEMTMVEIMLLVQILNRLELIESGAQSSAQSDSSGQDTDIQQDNSLPDNGAREVGFKIDLAGGATLDITVKSPYLRINEKLFTAPEAQCEELYKLADNLLGRS